jgi:ADP-ribosylation factor-like protein 2
MYEHHGNGGCGTLTVGTTGDVGGQKTLRSYWRNYFEKTDALIWVVDATDRLRIEDCRDELHGLLQEEVCLCLTLRDLRFCSLLMAQRLAGASLLIFANKTDVEGCMSENEISTSLRLDAIRTHQWHVLRCSAMTGKNLKEGLAWVVEDAKKRLFLY